MELGKPDAGKPPVRFDEGRETNGPIPFASRPLYPPPFGERRHNAAIRPETAAILSEADLHNVQNSRSARHIASKANDRASVCRQGGARRTVQISPVFLEKACESVRKVRKVASRWQRPQGEPCGTPAIKRTGQPSRARSLVKGVLATVAASYLT
jgi:hypothetical protein